MFFPALRHSWRQQREEWPLRLRTVPGKPDFMASGRWCGVSALLPGIQQREGVLDALLEDLIGELPVG